MCVSLVQGPCDQLCSPHRRLRPSRYHEFCFKNHGFCITNHEFWIKNHELCIKNDECCIKNDGCCIKNHGFCIKDDDFCITNDGFCITNQVSRTLPSKSATPVRHTGHSWWSTIQCQPLQTQVRPQCITEWHALQQRTTAAQTVHYSIVHYSAAAAHKQFPPTT